MGKKQGLATAGQHSGKAERGGERASTAPPARAAPSAASSASTEPTTGRKSAGKKRQRPAELETASAPAAAAAAAAADTSALDDIFGDVKKVKLAKAQREEQEAIARREAKAARKRREVNPFSEDGGKLGGGEEHDAPDKWGWADNVKPVRVDSEGLPIYTWDSLRIGQGGGTDLCPFDCDCCF
eukprot:TRINITY_DN2170_c0_g1_i1.p1 TRINITY_DN2170_c0_g1~~TRINITY_DN2170_c0_g1_i1.p1  ORF type:complete len:194 (+),score=46.47 TRINITY_DN2170_c0_g1_i1:32-583(+)